MPYSRTTDRVRFAVASVLLVIGPLLRPSIVAAQSLDRAVVVPLEAFDVRPGRLVPAAWFGEQGLAIGTAGQQVVLLDSAGRELRRYGGAGAGPGEIRLLAALGISGDTILALDATRRLTAFPPSGTPASRTMLVPSSVDIPFNPRQMSGRWVVHGQSATPGHPLIEARGQLNVRADLDGNVRDTIGVLDIRNAMMRISLRGGAQEIQLPQPYADIDRLAVAPGGEWIAVVRSPKSRFNARSRENAIELIGPRGRSTVHFATVLIPLTDASVRTWLDERATEFSRQVPGGRVAARSALVEQLHRPAEHPTVRGALIGDDGVLWLLQSAVDAPRDRWTLLAPSGTVLGTVEFATGTRLAAVARDGAWVVESDLDGNESLVRYRISLRR